MQLFVILVILAILLMIWISFSAVGLLIHFIPVIILGLICGAIASVITGSRHGILGDIGLGLLGSVLARFLFGVFFHYRPTNVITDVIVGVVGAVILLLIGKAFTRRSPRHY